MAKAGNPRPVPGAPDTTENTADGQRALRLHAGIAVIAFLLCTFVAVVFWNLNALPLAVIFAIVALLCLAALGRAIQRKRRGERAQRRDG
jgi:Flp pilus assembly protein TadB